MSYGLGNFLYDIDVTAGKDVNFKFWDQDDASNTAEVTVSPADFPEGVTQADSRQVADLAFAQCSKVLNDKRDDRLKREAADALEKKTSEDAQAREVAADHFANAQDVTTGVHHVDKDGTNVLNTDTSEKSGDDNNKSDKK